MKAKDIMRRDFLWFHGNDTFEHVLHELAKNRISSAPVFEEGEFLGIVSARSMVRHFSPKEFAFLWKKEKETPLEKMGKATAAQLAEKPRAILKPEQELSGALGVLSGDDCIPVIDGKKMAGLIRGEDIIGFFTTEVAKGEHRKGIAAAAPSSMRSRPGNMDTAIDGVLEIVKRKKAVSAKEVAAELGISQKSVENMGQTLHKHHIIRMEYSFLGGAMLRIIDEDKK